MSKYRVIVVVLVALGFFTCKKQVAGPKGDPGLPGSNGNSSQAHTINFSVAASRWDSVIVGDEVVWQASVGISEISKAIVQSGDVMVYTLEDGKWFELPYYVGLYVTQASYFEGFVQLEYSNMHGQIPTRPGQRNYRVVIFGPK